MSDNSALQDLSLRDLSLSGQNECVPLTPWTPNVLWVKDVRIYDLLVYKCLVFHATRILCCRFICDAVLLQLRDTFNLPDNQIELDWNADEYRPELRVTCGSRTR